jgi:hypothetical protein
MKNTTEDDSERRRRLQELSQRAEALAIGCNGTLRLSRRDFDRMMVDLTRAVALYHDPPQVPRRTRDKSAARPRAAAGRALTELKDQGST